MKRYEADIARDELRQVGVSSKKQMLGFGDFAVELGDGSRAFYSLGSVRKFIRMGFFTEDCEGPPDEEVHDDF